MEKIFDQIKLDYTNLVIGSQGTGKTVFIKKYINEFTTLHPERSVLIVSDTEEYKGSITMKESEKVFIQSDVSNHLIVIESSFFYGNNMRLVDSLLVSSVSKRNTILIALQSLSKATQPILNNTANIISFFQLDSCKRYRDRIPGIFYLNSFVKKDRFQYTVVDLVNNTIKCKGVNYHFALYLMAAESLDEHPYRFEIKERISELKNIYKLTK